MTKQLKNSVIAELEIALGFAGDVPKPADPAHALRAIEPLRNAEPRLHQMCRKLIEAGNPDRAYKLVVEAPEGSASALVQSKAFWLVFAVIVGLIPLIAAPLFIFVIGRQRPGAQVVGKEEEKDDEESGAKVTSKNDECASNLKKALAAFRDDDGLPFKIGKDDARALFERSVDERYFRDGSQYDVSFRVERNDGVCQLVLWRRKLSEPGHVKVTTGSFGSVDLKHCSCE